MRTGWRPGLSLAALGLLCTCTLSARTALAAGTAAPLTIDQIVGQYAMACKYVNVEVLDGKTWKGSYKSTFIISKTSATEVLLVWRNANGGEWSYRGLYANGVLTIGLGADASDPAERSEAMVLAFSGTPGKVSAAGTYVWQEWYSSEKFVDAETFKGKMTSTP